MAKVTGDALKADGWEDCVLDGWQKGDDNILIVVNPAPTPSQKYPTVKMTCFINKQAVFCRYLAIKTMAQLKSFTKSVKL